MNVDSMQLLRLVLFFASVVSIISCTDSLPDSGEYTCPCTEEYKCVAGTCRRLCTSDTDCPSSEFCAPEEFCAPRTEPFSFTYAAETQPAKLDILWVIDSSASMCQEQLALAQGAKQFLELLLDYMPIIDIRIAVTTADAIGNQGKFVNQPATSFPPACVESTPEACLSDIDCLDAFGSGWTCKVYDASQVYNLNGSVNSSCTFRCEDDSECCEEFCSDQCDSDQSCLSQMCDDSPNDLCSYECKSPGGDSSNSGCLQPPQTEDCPANMPEVLTNSNLDLFRCLAQVQPTQSYSANLEQGLKAAWQALDPEGPNAGQSASFLRPDAYLLIVFVTDEDDCSIDEEYCSPNYSCADQDDEDDCIKYGGNCRVDLHFSQLEGKEKRLCCGLIKKDYYNICSLLGDWKGYDHHALAYDLGESDCETNDECEDGWYCKTMASQKKCRPNIFYFKKIAAYNFDPPSGTPVFSLTPTEEYAGNFKSLKSDPAKVLVAAVSGDGLVHETDSKALISAGCLGEDRTTADIALAAKLDYCVAYKTLKEADSLGCAGEPEQEGCEEYKTAKLNCIRQCYIASKGHANNLMTARNTYICNSQSGRADFGSRYVKLAEMFGSNGLASNICSDEGIAPALQNIAELLVKNARRVCLPRAPVEGEQVTVVKALSDADGNAGDPVALVEGEGTDGDYVIVSPWTECCVPDDQGNCTGSNMAVKFTKLQEPNAVYQISYEKDSQE